MKIEILTVNKAKIFFTFFSRFAEALKNQNKADCIKLQTYQEYDKLLKEAKEAELKDKDIVLCTCIAAGGFANIF